MINWSGSVEGEEEEERGEEEEEEKVFVSHRGDGNTSLEQLEGTLIACAKVK